MGKRGDNEGKKDCQCRNESCFAFITKLNYCAFVTDSGAPSAKRSKRAAAAAAAASEPVIDLDEVIC